MADVVRSFIPMLLEIVMCFILGLLAIPLLRAKKTGRFEPRIGSRFLTDGSEPVMGGAVMAIAFSAVYFPLIFSTDLTNSSNKQDSREGLIFAGIYVIIIVCVGIAEDRLKYFLARLIGVAPAFKQAVIYVPSLSLTLVPAVFSKSSTEVLLPFNLGFIEFGALYYPLMALLMTVMVNSFKLHFCFGGDVSGSVGGLTEASGAISLLTVALCCEMNSSTAGSFFSNMAAAACIGVLLWTFPPSKLITGDSGSMCIGAMFASAVLLSKLELLFIIASLPQLADMFFSLVHYFRFKLIKRNKSENAISPKCSLHMFLSSSGYKDTTVVIIFLAIGFLGGALSLLFAHYSEGFLLFN
ncbi:MAG: hypothetical protein IJ555_12200 [Ruminococcus sp.]|nr:hypothetical protein [Ruminococcus sp.]